MFDKLKLWFVNLVRKLLGKEPLKLASMQHDTAINAIRKI